MQNQYRHIKGKLLRYGYSTGSCAAAAAKAATAMLFAQQLLHGITIETPGGLEIEFVIEEAVVVPDYASCCVTKDAGDDPDVTHGLKIYARAIVESADQIKITGGAGIGVVTKKGLAVEVGQPAINPVPMQMIVQEVRSVLPAGKGVSIEISAPEGVNIAQKTFNPQLGIVGGISILGTKGIVTPMSEDAYKESLALKLAMLEAQEVHEAVFTPGNYGERFIGNHYDIDPGKIITTSNFIGFMLDESVRCGFQKILLIGHIGKLIKVAGGIFHTHSHLADARNEIFAAHYLVYSGNAEASIRIMQCNTTEEAIDYVADDGFFNQLCSTIKERCQRHVKGALEVEAILFSEAKGFLGCTSKAGKWIADYFKPQP